MRFVHISTAVVAILAAHEAAAQLGVDGGGSINTGTSYNWTAVQNFNAGLNGVIGSTTPTSGFFNPAYSSRYAGTTDGGTLTFGGPTGTYNDICWTPTTGVQTTVLKGCGLTTNLNLEIQAAGTASIFLGNNGGEGLSASVDGGVGIGTTDYVQFHGVVSGAGVAYSNTTGADTSISEQFHLKGTTSSFFFMPDNAHTALQISQAVSGVDGLKLTLGTTTSGISGGVLVGDTVANEQINFDAGTGFLHMKSPVVLEAALNNYAPSGAAMLGITIPQQIGAYTLATPNWTNCGGAPGSFFMCNNLDAMKASGVGVPMSMFINRQVGGGPVSGATGGRFNSDFILLVDNGGTADTTNSFYQVMNIDMEARAPMGGSGTGSGATYLGATFAIGGYSAAENTALNLNEVSYEEGDLRIESGASVLKLHGITLVLNSTNAVAPIAEGTAFAIGAQPGALPTFDCGLCFNRVDGAPAMSSGAALLGFHPQNFAAVNGMTVAWGFDSRLIRYNQSFLSDYAGDMFDNGGYRAGYGQIVPTANGWLIDGTGSTAVSATVVSGGSNYLAGNYNPGGSGIPQGSEVIGCNGVWDFTANASGVVTAVTNRRPAWASGVPATTCVLQSAPGQLGSGAIIAPIWTTGTTVGVSGAWTLYGSTSGTDVIKPPAVAGTSIQVLPGASTGLVGALFTQTTPVTVASTAVETTIIGSGVGSLVLPANFLIPGRTLKITVEGYHSATATPTIDVKIKLGSTIVLDTGAVNSGGSSNSYVEARGFITCATTGVSGTVNAQGKYSEQGGGANEFGMVNISPVTIDTTSSQTINITVQWGTASASNTWTATNVIVETEN